jgi:hypothetical protein
MHYETCDCGELLKVAKGWDVWACVSCGSRRESARFIVSATSESDRMIAPIQSRRATGVEGPMNAPGQSAYKEADMVPTILSKAGA